MGLPESERLRLREFELSDVALLHGFVSDPLVCTYTDWGPNELHDTLAFLLEANAEAGQERRTRYSLAVVRRHDSRLVGSCALWEDSRQHARGSIGFVFDREVWRQGYATELARLLLRFGFQRLDLQRIEATCRPDNVGSRRALEKAGLRLEGLLRSHVLVRGVRQDSLVLAALRADLPS